MDENTMTQERTDDKDSVDVKDDVSKCSEPIRGAQKRKRRSVYSRIYNVDNEDNSDSEIKEQEALHIELENKQKASKTVSQGGEKQFQRKNKRYAKTKANETLSSVCKKILKPNKKSVHKGKSLPSPIKVKSKEATRRNKANKDTQTDSAQLEDETETDEHCIFKKSKAKPLTDEEKAESRWVIANIDNATCMVCNKTFKSRSSAIRHARVYHYTDGKEHNCTSCSATFQNKTRLSVHVVNAHRYSCLCDKCGKEFRHISHFQLHKQIYHGQSPNKALKCQWPGCEKTFQFHSNRQKHMSSVHAEERKYVCKQCPQKFKTSGALRSHEYTIHTDEKDKKKFPCVQCFKVFHTRSKLKYHKTIHLHESDAKKYFCPFEGCNSKFRLKDSLLKHEKVHANYKPFVCSVCQEAFSRRIYLETHQYKHTGVKQYQCEICNKAFTQKGNLTVHMRLHSGKITEYLCKICNSTFNFKSNYTKHIKAHEDGTASTMKPKPRQQASRGRRNRSIKEEVEEDELVKAFEASGGTKGKQNKGPATVAQVIFISGNTAMPNVHKKKKAAPASLNSTSSSQSNIFYILDNNDDYDTNKGVDNQQGNSTNLNEGNIVEIVKDEGFPDNDITDEEKMKSDLSAEVVAAMKREGISLDNGVNVTVLDQNVVTVQSDFFRDVLPKDQELACVSNEASSSVITVQVPEEMTTDNSDHCGVLEIENSQNEAPLNLVTKGAVDTYALSAEIKDGVTAVGSHSTAFEVAPELDPRSLASVLDTSLITQTGATNSTSVAYIAESVAPGSPQVILDRHISDIDIPIAGNQNELQTESQVRLNAGNQITMVTTSQIIVDTENQFTLAGENQVTLANGNMVEGEAVHQFDMIPTESEIVVISEPDAEAQIF